MFGFCLLVVSCFQAQDLPGALGNEGVPHSFAYLAKEWAIRTRCVSKVLDRMSLDLRAADSSLAPRLALHKNMIESCSTSIGPVPLPVHVLLDCDACSAASR